MLVSQIAPVSSDRILDVGCGTGTLAIQLKATEPAANILALDPDPAVVTKARRKASSANCEIDWHVGFLDEETVAILGEFSKVVSSLVLHQTPMNAKRSILRSAYSLLKPGGTLHVADYGLQRSSLMRSLFRDTVQRIDGTRDTQPNADGVLVELIQYAGFSDVEETGFIRTLTGSISFYRATVDK